MSRMDHHRLLEDAITATGASRAVVLGRSRVAAAVQQRRQVARWLRRRGLSYPAVGELLGRSHATVMHLCWRTGWRAA